MRFSTIGRGLYQLEPAINGGHTPIHGEGSEVNALRHGTWMGTIAARYGDEVASFVGNAHEGLPTGQNVRELKQFDLNQRVFDIGWGYDVSYPDKIVDMLNNEIGCEIGKNAGSTSMKDISLKVLEHFHKEGMYVFDFWDPFGAIGGATISGEFTDVFKVKDLGDKYRVHGTVDYYLYDKFADPFDMKNLIGKEWDALGVPYDIDDQWMGIIKFEIDKDIYDNKIKPMIEQKQKEMIEKWQKMQQ
ncbi:DUF6973 domain-containing protein [Xenorhabdus sp. Sc-CR9]|uniref:DUF6973 domain-containing protein n=1 Tax=Xenorhabdus sp. Sc-CR9 TaxID=2584468 RepID=UPI001F39AFAA|nr:hypothetical protein [Xenorhabdus sp. Sc-CR9]